MHMGKRPKTYRLLCGACLAALCFTVPAALADPSPGFGLYAGPVASSYKAVYGTSHGIAFAGDAQFVFDKDWTLSPYLAFTSEQSTSSVHVVELTGGLQARYWVSSWFLGGQYLFHSTLLTRSGSTISGNVGPSLGLVTGWEGANHWSLVLEANFLEGNGFAWTTGPNRSDVRVLVGYHWY